MEKKLRQQLTLFVNKEEAGEIERIRKQFNPVQQALIDSHVTLCREDEIENMDAVVTVLEKLEFPPITIRFGPVTRFENGAGVLLPATGDRDPFHLLRSRILSGSAAMIRKPEPHITLMHPRNSFCTDTVFEQIQKIQLPDRLTLKRISLIEQENGEPWKTLKEFNFNS